VDSHAVPPPHAHLAFAPRGSRVAGFDASYHDLPGVLGCNLARADNIRAAATTRLAGRTPTCWLTSHSITGGAWRALRHSLAPLLLRRANALVRYPSGSNHVYQNSPPDNLTSSHR